jgi:hypothetical protein
LDGQTIVKPTGTRFESVIVASDLPDQERNSWPFALLATRANSLSRGRELWSPDDEFATPNLTFQAADLQLLVKAT